MKKKAESKNLIKRVLWVFYAIALFGVVVFSLYHLLFAKTVIPGTRIKNANLGRLNFSQTLVAIKGQIPNNQTLKLTYGDQTFDIPLQEIGLNYDIEQTAKTAFKVGRDGNFFENFKAKVAGIFNPIYISYVFSYEDEALNDRLDVIVKSVDTPHSDARFSLSANGDLIIIPEETGAVMDKESVKSEILKNISNAVFLDLSVKTEVYQPKLTQGDLETVQAKVGELINNLPMFVFGGKSWLITKNDFLQMVIFSRKDAQIEISADKEKVKKFVISIAEQINRPPKSEIFKVEGEKVVDFRLPTPGYVVKEHPAMEIFSLALLDSSMERQIDIPAEEFMPFSQDNSYGIKELIGEGVSTFVGSAAGRMFNIELASKNLNGILIAPGEIFSFNSNVGPIDYAHGFTSAYIISKGRTVLGEGGGVCQVSTTMFRAVLNSGLPVISRTAHAYRVSYYEQDMPVGFDATVYQPTVDFKFKNDTQNYILVQSEYIAKESKLYFRFYGTKDGRVVKGLSSKILSQTPPPVSLYQDDPSLPKGVTKQVDWSVWGAVVELKRVVEKDGKVVYEDTFISNYQPWRAVYLVGTVE